MNKQLKNLMAILGLGLVGMIAFSMFGKKTGDMKNVSSTFIEMGKSKEQFADIIAYKWAKNRVGQKIMQIFARKRAGNEQEKQDDTLVVTFSMNKSKAVRKWLDNKGKVIAKLPKSEGKMSDLEYVTLVSPDLDVTGASEDSRMENAVRQASADGVIEVDEIENGSALSVF